MFARPWLMRPRRILLWIILWLLLWLGVFGVWMLATAAGRGQAPAATSQRTDYRSVIIELAAPSAAEVYAEHAVETASTDELAAITQAQIADLAAAQDALLAALTPFEVQVLFQTQRVYNGIAVRLPAGSAAEIAVLPGVKAVHPLIAKHPANGGAVTAIGAPTLWQTGATGLTGAGVRVAIVDTGIDYLHRNFGGPGSVTLANNPTLVGDVPNFPGEKVVGGYDFAGNSYNATLGSLTYQPIPQPDPDPADCYGVGHGSHVAGTIGGYGVTPLGQTYGGPYSPAADLTQLSIAPGVAPHVELYALKVFGCAGSSEIVELAVEWAIDPDRDGDFRDRVDILNLSLGIDFGAAYDSTAVAVENAARTGMIVVAAAGNIGDLSFAANAPGIADHAISVAASTLADGVIPEGIAVFSARGPRRGDGLLKPDIAAPGKNILSTQQGTGVKGVTLSGTSMASAVAAGALALLRQAHPAPGWRAEELKALIMNTASGPLVTAGQAAYGPMRAGAGRIDLPAALASDLIAYDAQKPAVVSVNFGLPEVLDTYTAVRSLRVVNKGASPISVTVGYSEVNRVAGVAIGVDVGRVLTVPGRSSVALPVTLIAVADQMAWQPDPTRTAADPTRLAALAEVAGFVRLTPVTGPVIQTPVYAAPQHVGWLEVVGPALDFGATASITTALTLTGTLPDGSFPPTQTVALMGLFALQQASPPITAGPDGAPPDLYAAADVRYVGVAGPLDGKLAFAVAAYKPWSSPQEVVFVIELDSDGDGIAEYRLANRDSAFLDPFGPSDADEFIGVLEEIGTATRLDQGPLNEYSPAVYDTRLLNSDVMVLPLLIADLDTPVTQLRYRVVSYATDVSSTGQLGSPVDQTRWHMLDLAQPRGLAAVGWARALLPAADAPEVVVAFNRQAATLAGVDGLLVVQLHNPIGLRAQVLPLSYTWPYSTRLPWTHSSPP